MCIGTSQFDLLLHMSCYHCVHGTNIVGYDRPPMLLHTAVYNWLLWHGTNHSKIIRCALAHHNLTCGCIWAATIVYALSIFVVYERPPTLLCTSCCHCVRVADIVVVVYNWLLSHTGHQHCYVQAADVEYVPPKLLWWWEWEDSIIMLE